MAGVAAKFIPRELLIHTPDGAIRPLLLERDRYTLGRSSANELCYPEDAGLSRQHLALERDGDTWSVQMCIRDSISATGPRCVRASHRPRVSLRAYLE